MSLEGQNVIITRMMKALFGKARTCKYFWLALRAVMRKNEEEYRSFPKRTHHHALSAKTTDPSCKGTFLFVINFHPL